MFDLSTTRLELRPLGAADAEALHALWTDVDVRRFLWDGECIPLERTRAVITESERLFTTERRGLWGVWLRADNQLGMLDIRASTDVPNEASVRVLERLGFRLVRRATVGELDTLFFDKRVDDYG